MSIFFYRNPEFRIRFFPDELYMNSGFSKFFHQYDIEIKCSQIQLGICYFWGVHDTILAWAISTESQLNDPIAIISHSIWILRTFSWFLENCRSIAVLHISVALIKLEMLYIIGVYVQIFSGHPVGKLFFAVFKAIFDCYFLDRAFLSEFCQTSHRRCGFFYILFL